MTWATGVLKWPPEQFKRATFYELSVAYIGHCRYNGEGFYRRDANGFAPAEIDDFKKDIVRLQAKFPDGHKSHYRKQRDKAADRGDAPAVEGAGKRSKAEKRALRNGQ